jgi:hypothetical protein
MPAESLLLRRSFRRRGGAPPGEPGDLVQAPTASRTTPLFTGQRIDSIRVFCDAPENDVPHLHIGDPAIVRRDLRTR